MKNAIIAYAMMLSILCINTTLSAQDFKYSLFHNRIIITRYADRDKHVVVPETLDGYPVAMIGRSAFQNNTEMVSITLPETIVMFGEAAFRGCVSLSEILLPDHLVLIDDQAFGDCATLTHIRVGKNNREFTNVDGVLFNKSATTLIQYPIGRQQTTYSVPDGVITIGHRAFQGAANLMMIDLPDSLAVVGDSAFRNCTSLTHVVLPEGVTFVRDFAFHGCEALTEVTIPASVTSIGFAAFEGCARLSNVTIMNGVRNLSGSIFSGCSDLKEILIPVSVVTIGGRAFHNCEVLTDIQVADDNVHYASNDGALIHKDSRTLVQYPRGRLGSYRVPDRIVHIAGKAFQGCVGLSELSLPGSVAVIGNSAFRDCENLAQVHWRESHQDESVISVHNEKRIGDAAFRNCAKLKMITLPNSVTSIGDSAFQECGKLEAINLGDGMTSLGDSAFRKCSSLAQITLPGSLTNIGRTAFFRCSALTGIDIADGNRVFTALDGVVYDKQRPTLLQYPPGRAGHYAIPDGIEEIGAIAFGSAQHLTGVTLPQSVRLIGRHAFSMCSNLEGLYFLGDKPTIAPDAIRGNVTLYYRNGTRGWDVETSRWPIEPWTAIPDDSDIREHEQ